MNANRAGITPRARRVRTLTLLSFVIPSAGLVTLSGCAVPINMPPGSTSILFDGGEGTSSGTTDFSFGGANFSGGTVRTAGNPSLYGSGFFAYEVREASTVVVTFDAPIDFLELVFILRGTGTTVLTAFDANDNEVGTITAGSARAAQEVLLSANAVRVEVVHTGDGDGWIDNFTFRPAS